MIQYKSVPGPVGITINRNDDYTSAVKQYASIIDRESVGGWKFECIRKIPVTKKAGCLASLFGQENTTLYMNMLVFSKDDAEGMTDSTSINLGEISSAGQINSEDTLGETETIEDSSEGNSEFVNKVPASLMLDADNGLEPEEPEHSITGSINSIKNIDKKYIYIVVAAVAVVVLGAVIIKSINNSKSYDYYDDYADDNYYDEYGDEYSDGYVDGYCTEYNDDDSGECEEFYDGINVDQEVSRIDYIVYDKQHKCKGEAYTLFSTATDDELIEIYLDDEEIQCVRVTSLQSDRMEFYFYDCEELIEAAYWEASEDNTFYFLDGKMIRWSNAPCSDDTIYYEDLSVTKEYLQYESLVNSRAQQWKKIARNR